MTQPAATGRPPLRVGILVDDHSQPAWVRRILADLQKSEIAELTLVVNNRAAPASCPAWRTLVDRPHHALYGLYTRVDLYLFGERPGGRGPRIKAGVEEPASDASAMADIGDVLGVADSLVIQPIQEGYSDYFPNADVEAILGYRLDVVLRFGFRILRGRALDIARYGVWSYHHGDNRVNRGGPAAFWEVFERAPTTGSVLQVLTEDLDNGIVIYRGETSTDPYSVTRTRNNCFWLAASFVQRCLRDVHAADPPPPLASVDPPSFRPYSNRLYKAPRNGEMARLLARHGARVLRARAERACIPEQWALAYSLRPDAPSMHRFRYLLPGEGRLWADPFPVVHEGRHHVFFEEQVPGRPAHIAVMRLENDGKWSAPVPALRSEQHMSYPFVFEWDGDLFMVPETITKRRVGLYRCTTFPDEWQLEQVLLEDVRAVDATLAEVDGAWWMFVSIAPEEAALFDELYLYRAETPFGPWLPHARNPVKSDATNSRSAGRLFRQGDKLFRPAQDCGPRYGYAVVINEIERLDTESFVEREVARLRPVWDRNVTATHTFNSVPGLTVCDVRLRRVPRRLRRQPSSGR